MAKFQSTKISGTLQDMINYMNSVKTPASKYSSNYLKVKKYIESEARSKNVKKKINLAKFGCALDILAANKSPEVRKIAGPKFAKAISDIRSEGKKGFDDYINKLPLMAKKELINNGVCIDILRNDTDINIRMELAKNGYCLNKLYRDKSVNVRSEVLKYMCKSSDDIIKRTTSCKLKCNFVDYFDSLIILSKEKSVSVKNKVFKSIECVISILSRDNSETIRVNIAKLCTKTIKHLMKDESGKVRAAIINGSYKIDRYMDDDNYFVKCALIDKKLKLNEYMHDPDPRIRARVVNQGYKLDEFDNDDADEVVYALIKQNHNVMKYIKHPDEGIRVAVRTQLLKDPEYVKSLHTRPK